MPKRLQEPAFLILSALTGKPLHGYGIAQAVSELSGGDVTLRVGTLYGALDRLSERGWIEVNHEEVVDSRLRRYYRLTDAGAEVLATEAAVLERRATRALELLGRRRPTVARGMA
ncbi:PadR family transcriptional regulator [Georgenia daeguensis]